MFAPCTCCRRNKRNARKVNGYRPAADFPVVSVSAFLKLADWYRAYLIAMQGGDPCPTAKKEPFSGTTGCESADKPAAAVGSSSRAGSPASAADAQSHRGPADPAASQQRGGDA